MKGKIWKRLVGGTMCAAMALGTVYAGEGETGGSAGKGRGNRPAHARQGRNKGQGQNQRGPIIEEMKTEMERFKAEQEGLREEAKALREKVRAAVKEVCKGEGRPDPETVEPILEQFKDEAAALATRMTEARIQHHANVVTILETNKETMVDRMAKMLLSPRGKGRGARNGEKNGDRQGRRQRRNKDNAGGDLDWNADPAE